MPGQRTATNRPTSPLRSTITGRTCEYKPTKTILDLGLIVRDVLEIGRTEMASEYWTPRTLLGEGHRHRERPPRWRRPKEPSSRMVQTCSLSHSSLVLSQQRDWANWRHFWRCISTGPEPITAFTWYSRVVDNSSSQDHSGAD